ncbi:hypothetical protein Sxan_53990 [Streptomyces xanthophaeus]|uniref:Uncharacterized protein n=1 Tax=Streptomyces xanthophaeus TaxID=67385 RepID=A0A919H1D6_9ACTN|nr:hypothetical protein Sxan_53990 [Streptomyces xanthophaeus]
MTTRTLSSTSQQLPHPLVPARPYPAKHPSLKAGSRQSPGNEGACAGGFRPSPDPLPHLGRSRTAADRNDPVGGHAVGPAGGRVRTGTIRPTARDRAREGGRAPTETIRPSARSGGRVGAAAPATGAGAARR